MKIALYGKEFSEDFKEKITGMFRQFKDFQADIYIHDRFKQILERSGLTDYTFTSVYTDQEGLPGDTEVLLSLGGDGTFLETLRFVIKRKVPVLGINTGRLGFLANISRDELKDSIQCLLKNEYTTETRSLINLTTSEGPLDEFDTALS